MKLFYSLSLTLLTFLIALTSCEKAQVFPASIYSCENPLEDSILTHPSGTVYQNILDKNRADGLVGAVLLVKDQDGLWIGSSGKADIASNVDMQPCNTFLVASISKVFTATAIFRYIDRGILSLNDPLDKWISPSITAKIENGDEAQIKHLLSHTSGIRDYYTDKFELDRVNRVRNGWTKEEVLEYVYGGKADFKVGETYGYSNTNYLLLSMILESASGLSFEEVYRQEVFLPSQLESAYYSETQRHDASIGVLLEGDGKGGFRPMPFEESGFFAQGDVKDMALLEGQNGRKIVVIARNNMSLKVVRER